MFSVYADDKLFYSPRLLDERYAITEPQATLELNKAGSFTFNLPFINPMYSSLKKLKTITTVASLVAWWKNNSFTQEALAADVEYERQRKLNGK